MGPLLPPVLPSPNQDRPSGATLQGTPQNPDIPHSAPLTSGTSAVMNSSCSAESFFTICMRHFKRGCGPRREHQSEPRNATHCSHGGPLLGVPTLPWEGQPWSPHPLGR